MTRATSHIVVWTLAFTGAAWVGSLPVTAQTVEPGEIRDQVTATASAFSGYDTDVTSGSVSDPRVDSSGSHVGTSISMRYRGRRRHINFSTQGDSDLRRYHTAETLTAASFFGSAAMDADVTRRLRVSGSVHSSYLPQFQFTITPYSSNAPSDIVAPTLDRSISRGEIVTIRSDAGLIYKLSSGSHFELNYGAGRHTLVDGNYRMTTQSFAGALSRNLTRYATLRLGYGEQHVTYPTAFGAPMYTLRNRMIDAGVNYSRPLSPTRRTTVGFGTGTAAVENAADQFFTVTGHASLTHFLAKTWSIAGVYSRGLAIVPGFTEPFFADAVVVNLDGGMREKLILQASVGYSKGNVGMGPRANDYSGMDWSARAEIPIRRRQVWLFANYFYYGYSFDESVRLPLELARGVRRHGVRGGLTLKVPLLVKRARRAPR